MNYFSTQKLLISDLVSMYRWCFGFQTQNPMMATTIQVPAYHVVPENTHIYPMDGH